SHNEVRLRPRDDDLQRCLSFELKTEPFSSLRSRPDYFGNTVHYLSVPEAHRRLVIRAESLVETLPPPHLGPPRDRPLPLVELERPAVRDPLVEYLTPSQYVPLADEIRQVAMNLARGAGGDGAAFWNGLLAYFRDNLTYETGS